MSSKMDSVFWRVHTISPRRNEHGSITSCTQTAFSPAFSAGSRVLSQTSESSGATDAAFHLLARVTPNATLQRLLLSDDSFAEAGELASSVYSTYEEEDAAHVLQSRLSHILNPAQRFTGEQQTKRVQLLHNLPSIQSPCPRSGGVRASSRTGVW